jgi:hypothetical protein
MEVLIKSIYEEPVNYDILVENAKLSYKYSSMDIFSVLNSSLTDIKKKYILNQLVLVVPSRFPQGYNMQITMSDDLTESLYSLNLDWDYVEKYIKDLSCLSLISNLQRLSLLYLEITSFGLSKLLNLEELYLSELYMITSLSDIPPNIKKLTIKGCREINNENLGELSKYTLLEELTLKSLNITNIDFLNIPNLKKVNIESCHDIVNTDNLSLISSLEVIEISHCYKLQTIKIENLPNLQNLKIWSTKSTTLQLTNLPKINKFESISNHLLENIKIVNCPELSDN